MAKKKSSTSFVTIFFTASFIALVAAAAYFLFYDQEQPIVTLTPSQDGSVSLSKNFVLDIKDEKTGLKSVVVTVKRDGNSMDIINTNFIDRPKNYKVEFNLENTKLPNGDFTLEIRADDASYAKIISGNTVTSTYSFTMDIDAPTISVLSPAPNIKRGGSALITYKVSEHPVKTGIYVDELFFPAFKYEDNYVCLFPFPYNYNSSNYIPQIMAEDKAGNITKSKLIANIQNRIFPDDIVKISDKFLETKEAEFRKILPSDEPTLELYKRINTEVRKENDQLIRDISWETAPTFYFTKAFIRQPKSASMANFGDSRTYMYNGEKIDFQYHLGIDLASVKEDIVRCSNKGKVIYTGYLGIYGNVVIVDHGRNLQTLYSHLTDIHVKEGDMVDVNSDLGTTGISGLAVGDHVHFAFLVGGIAVQPVEWLDAVWVRNNITSRMKY